ncbi:MAG: tRNA (adenosine(37)-N6)-threonylcarbamoyltransferase complex transferase subunit TsaD [Planctomycetota bacterium]
MLILGIESSCDETAAALVDGTGIVRSSTIASQIDLHAEYGGVVPEIASREHVARILPVVRSALADADARLTDIDAIAVSHRPGLVGSLLVGVAAAKALAWSLGVPLYAVDHVHAHLHAAFLRDADAGSHASTRATDAIERACPALGLVVSGGHSTIYHIKSGLELERLGATIDDAIGEAFDKAASILGLAYPGGPEIDRLASLPNADDRLIDLPVSRLAKDSLDFSFSGLKTALLYQVNGVPKPRNRSGHPGDRAHEPVPEMTPERTRDLAACFQRAAIRAIELKLDRAAAHLDAHGVPIRALVAGGGVVANSRLRAALQTFAAGRDIALHIPSLSYCMDNAAMIAGLGVARHAAGTPDTLAVTPVPTTAC